VLYVGSEDPRKNLPRLLEALTLVRERLPSVKLIKIGSPQYLSLAKRLRERIKELGLSEAVLWCEHVSDQDLAQFYNVGDVFAFPSRYEGFGLPLLEAMACGTPVVCSNAASLPEVVGDAAIMVPPQDAQGLADALYEVLTEQKLRDELRRKGLRRVRRFTWERRARQTVAVYRKVWRSFCQNT
jgi:glycosyltransferase involved in cell wall biosynthesis